MGGYQERLNGGQTASKHTHTHTQRTSIKKVKFNFRMKPFCFIFVDSLHDTTAYIDIVYESEWFDGDPSCLDYGHFRLP